jgi:hypothetical protein
MPHYQRPQARAAHYDLSTNRAGEWLCTYCQQPLSPTAGRPDSATLDHVIPRLAFEETDQNIVHASNMVPACQRCNRLKAQSGQAKWLNELRSATGQHTTVVRRRIEKMLAISPKEMRRRAKLVKREIDHAVHVDGRSVIEDLHAARMAR